MIEIFPHIAQAHFFISNEFFYFDAKPNTNGCVRVRFGILKNLKKWFSPVFIQPLSLYYVMFGRELYGHAILARPKIQPMHAQPHRSPCRPLAR